MSERVMDNSIYVVISQTGTVLSRILRMITRREYNHASISFCNDLNIMYSFGRNNPYNPFWGGFVKESASFGTFKRFSGTKVIVLKLETKEDTYVNMKKCVEEMAANPQNYRYNYLGLCIAALRIKIHRKNCYYCSEFVRDMLLKFDVHGADKLLGIIHPMQFLEIPHAQTVYSGKLCEYSYKEIAVVN